LHELINVKGALPSQIIILTPRKQENSLWQEGSTLGNYKLTWNISTLTGSNIRVSTIHSFKGLESPIVILTELDQAFTDTRDQLIYIGVSRARNHLVVIGSLPSSDGSNS
jgi:superfamily I DNA/RNA helicase